MSVPSVVVEAPSLFARLVAWLDEHGLTAANALGNTEVRFDECSVGLLCKTDLPLTKPKKFLFVTVGHHRLRRVFVGVIWIDNLDRGAAATHWAYEVFGQGILADAEALATEMAAHFGVKISIKVTRPHPQWEEFISDGPGVF